VVFDVASGEMKPASAADGGTTGDGGGGSADDGPDAGRDGSDGGGDGPPPLDPETEAVLAELAAVDVAETAPVELLSRVQEWQARVEGSPALGDARDQNSET
jgi:DNA mismatch repair protein MutS